MQHFFVNPDNIHRDFVKISDPKILHQMARVLRMEPGSEFMALDNTGFEFQCRLEKIDDNAASASILEKQKNIAEPVILITLYQALPKKMELFEWVLQKGTEIGVSRFVPLVTERTERREISKSDRLEKILREAAEQCERGKIPELLPIQKFQEAVTRADGKQKFLLHGRAARSGLVGPERAAPKEGGRVSDRCEAQGRTELVGVKREAFLVSPRFDLFVGPEGGFTEEEIQEAKTHGLQMVSLGPRVLRTETAGVAAAGLVLL